jgi:hypothetical protein
MRKKLEGCRGVGALSSTRDMKDERTQKMSLGGFPGNRYDLRSFFLRGTVPQIGIAFFSRCRWNDKNGSCDEALRTIVEP